jgi:hypothetical protein
MTDDEEIERLYLDGVDEYLIEDGTASLAELNSFIGRSRVAAVDETAVPQSASTAAEVAVAAEPPVPVAMAVDEGKPAAATAARKRPTCEAQLDALAEFPLLSCTAIDIDDAQQQLLQTKCTYSTDCAEPASKVVLGRAHFTGALLFAAPLCLGCLTAYQLVTSAEMRPLPRASE